MVFTDNFSGLLSWNTYLIDSRTGVGSPLSVCRFSYDLFVANLVIQKILTTWTLIIWKKSKKITLKTGTTGKTKSRIPFEGLHLNHQHLTPYRFRENFKHKLNFHSVYMAKEKNGGAYVALCVCINLCRICTKHPTLKIHWWQKPSHISPLRSNTSDIII